MAAAAQAAPSARIISSVGSVQLTRPDSGQMKRIPIRTGEFVFNGDLIKTGMNARLVIELKDRSQAIISPNTTVEIKDANNSPRTIFNLLRGKTRIKIEKLGGKPNPYRITTPTTVIAVRGTIFDVFVKNDETSVFVLEGEVSVALLSSPDQEVILTPGQFTKVKGNESPQPPAPFKIKQNDNIFNPVLNSGFGQSPFENPAQGTPGNRDLPGMPGTGRGNTPGNVPNVPVPSGEGNRRGKP